MSRTSTPSTQCMAPSQFMLCMKPFSKHILPSHSIFLSFFQFPPVLLTPKSLGQCWSLNPRLLESCLWRDWPWMSHRPQDSTCSEPNNFLSDTQSLSFPQPLVYEPLVYHCISIFCPRSLGSVSFSWGKEALPRTLGLTPQFMVWMLTPATYCVMPTSLNFHHVI